MENSNPEDIASKTAEKIAEGFGREFYQDAKKWSKKQIKNLIRKIIDRDLALIEDEETFDIAKEIRKTGEWDFFKEYVKK